MTFMNMTLGLTKGLLDDNLFNDVNGEDKTAKIKIRNINSFQPTSIDRKTDMYCGLGYAVTFMFGRADEPQHHEKVIDVVFYLDIIIKSEGVETVDREQIYICFNIRAF